MVGLYLMVQESHLVAWVFLGPSERHFVLLRHTDDCSESTWVTPVTELVSNFISYVGELQHHDNCLDILEIICFLSP